MAERLIPNGHPLDQEIKAVVDETDPNDCGATFPCAALFGFCYMDGLTNNTLNEPIGNVYPQHVNEEARSQSALRGIISAKELGCPAIDLVAQKYGLLQELNTSNTKDTP